MSALQRTIKVWLNVYRHPDPRAALVMHPTREIADATCLDNRIACIEREITYEIGEGLTPPASP